MKKFSVNGLFVVAAAALALGLGACNKNDDCCGGKCKDKAVMKDGSTTEASAKSCSEKASCATKCSGEKKAQCADKADGMKN